MRFRSIALVLVSLFGLGPLGLESVPASEVGGIEGDGGFPRDIFGRAQAIASPGSPGGVSVFGAEAWPLVAGGEVPVVAAAQLEGGRGGRIVAFTQGGYVGAGVLKDHDTERFLRRLGGWAGGGKRKATWASVGGGACALADALGERVAEEWREADLLIATSGNTRPERLADLRAHLARGGGIFVGCTPWGWQQLTPKLRLSRDLTLNRLMAPFGLAFDHRMATDTTDDGFLVEPEPDRLLHAGVAFEELTAGGLSPDQIELAGKTLRGALASLGDHEPLLMMPLRDFAARGDSELSREIAGWLEKEDERRGLRPLGERWGAWHLIGPFTSGRRGSGLDREQPIERVIGDWTAGARGPELEQSWKGDKGKVRWQRVELERDGLEFDVGELAIEELLARGLTEKQLGKSWSDGTTALLWRRIEIVRDPSDPIQKVSYDTRLQADDGLRVYLDGELIGEAETTDEASSSETLPEVRFRLELSPGVHHLVVKLVHPDGAWRFRTRGAEGLDRSAVNAAIGRGCDYLIEQQYLDGSWPGYSGYGVGLSALNLYALAASGLPRDHPAIVRGLAYLDAFPSRYVYSLGCEMLARARLDRGDQKEALTRSSAQMAGWIEPSGLFAYPVHPGGQFLPDDVSNTLFAALALAAAGIRGVDVDAKLWRDMIDGTLRCMEREPSGSSGRVPLGISYRPGGTPTGSMTTAGLSILVMARNGLNRHLTRRESARIDKAIDRGLAWIDAHLIWDSDPSGGWHYFFLYGIERTGSLLGVDILGGVPWYDSGAEYLLGQQREEGHWTSRQPLADTALALLFLNRATAPTSGDERTSDWRLLSAEGDLNLRARIGSEGLDTWLTGTSTVELTAHNREPRRAPRLEMVQWIGIIDGREVVLEEVKQGGTAQRFAARLDPPTADPFELFARAQAIDEEGDEPRRFELDSPRLQVPAIYNESQLAYAHDHRRNLLVRASAEATSSDGRCKPRDAIDSNHSTNWIFRSDDLAPVWTANMASVQPADRLLITHRGPRPEHQGLDRVEGVRVWINGEHEFELDMESDLMKKTVLLFGEELRVRRIEIEILAPLGKSSGFSEVQLLLGDD
jgi:hypothetical protein